MLNYCKTVCSKKTLKRTPYVTREMVKYNCISCNGILDSHSKEGGRFIYSTWNDSNETANCKATCGYILFLAINQLVQLSTVPQLSFLLSLWFHYLRISQEHLKLPHFLPIQEHEDYLISHKTCLALLVAPVSLGTHYPTGTGSFPPVSNILRSVFCPPKTSFLPANLPFF